MHIIRSVAGPVSRWLISAVTFSGLALGAAEAPVAVAPAAPAFETKAEAALKAMSEFLRTQPMLVATCERVVEGVTYDDEKIQMVGQITVKADSRRDAEGHEGTLRLRSRLSQALIPAVRDARETGT